MSQQLPKGAEAPSLARAAVRSFAGDVPARVLDDATLLVSELVTNSVKYGGEGRIRLEVEAGGDRLRAEIVDQGSGFDPLPREQRELATEDEGGWGLHLVESLAADWGVREGSTHVWFELRSR